MTSIVDVPCRYELAFNAEMVGEQFRLSRELADELGVPRSRVVSLRDVPGTTRALIPLLVLNNITALTVGVNNQAPNPAMPTPSRWVDSGSATSVLFMQTGCVLLRFLVLLLVLCGSRAKLGNG